MSKKNYLLLVALNLVISFGIIWLGITFENWQPVLLIILQVQYCLFGIVVILWHLCTRKLSRSQKYLDIACLLFVLAIALLRLLHFPPFYGMPLVVMSGLILVVLSLVLTKNE